MRKIQITAILEYRNYDESEADHASKMLVEEIEKTELPDRPGIRVTHVKVIDQEENTK